MANCSVIDLSLRWVSSTGFLVCKHLITPTLSIPLTLLVLVHSSLGLANKHLLTGSIKLVYTLTYTLFLAFCLSFGFDLFLIIRDIVTKGHDVAVSSSTSIMVTGVFTLMPLMLPASTPSFLIHQLGTVNSHSPTRSLQLSLSLDVYDYLRYPGTLNFFLLGHFSFSSRCTLFSCHCITCSLFARGTSSSWWLFPSSHIPQITLRQGTSSRIRR